MKTNFSIKTIDEKFIEINIRVKKSDLENIKTPHGFSRQKHTKRILEKIDFNGESENFDYLILILLRNIIGFFKTEQNNTSKKIKQTVQKQNIRLKGWVEKLILQWNEYPTVTKHKRESVQAEIQKYLTQLMNGTFAKKNKISSEFVKMNKIPTKLLHSRFSIVQMSEGIRRLSLLSVNGYWPSGDKSKFRSLKDLLFNSWTGSSMFLSVMDKEPKLLAESVFGKDDHPETTKLFLEKLFQGESLKSDSIKKLKYGIQSIADYQQKIKITHPKYKRVFGNVKILCSSYIDYIETQDWLFEKGINIGIIRSTSKIFKNFIEQLEEIYPLIKLPKVD